MGQPGKTSEDYENECAACEITVNVPNDAARDGLVAALEWMQGDKWRGRLLSRRYAPFPARGWRPVGAVTEPTGHRSIKYRTRAMRPHVLAGALRWKKRHRCNIASLSPVRCRLANVPRPHSGTRQLAYVVLWPNHEVDRCSSFKDAPGKPVGDP